MLPLCATLNLGNISRIFVLMPTVMDSLTNKKSDADQLTYFGLWFARSSCIEQFQLHRLFRKLALTIGIHWHLPPQKSLKSYFCLGCTTCVESEQVNII